MKHLILIDGSSVLYRAYHVFPSLTNSKGEPIGAIFGFINVLKSLIKKYNSTHIGIVFDISKKTFRNKIFVNYKCNRSPMPSNLVIQIEPLYDIISAMGLRVITVTDVEADDVIGTLVVKYTKLDFSILISSNDKDMAQLVRSNVNLISNTKSILGPYEIEQKYGVLPELIVDLIAIMGDRSDNIPGIPRIGQKTAINLIKTLGNIKSIYSNLNKISSLSFRGAKNTAIKLEQYRDLAFLSYNLAKIKTDVVIHLDYEDLAIKDINIVALKKAFNRYEFRSFLNYLI
ncbi:hypothetical protein CRV12_03070 [Candidatus Pantoea edessiphila]|uniref:5'-3' exonuclease domain-containing protein n=1 Tax=Candidatus Pantoea edessiphila TaxID=2044610 RepID=A0A2P5SZN2_9GAMM|nr:5'-3' exonuclease H3TH domain-containing protein [Candidatus Pantoea edessiphila]PPI87794.1 hypothetical protein CRV12_03070 [Candidatus Pantoea edessiphila]